MVSMSTLAEARARAQHLDGGRQRRERGAPLRSGPAPRGQGEMERLYTPAHACTQLYAT
jgi:hypothetical protein